MRFFFMSFLECINKAKTRQFKFENIVSEAVLMQKQATERLRRTIAFPRLAKQETAALFSDRF